MNNLYYEKFKDELSELQESWFESHEAEFEEQDPEFTWEDAMDLFFPNAKNEKEIEDELEDIWN